MALTDPEMRAERLRYLENMTWDVRAGTVPPDAHAWFWSQVAQAALTEAIDRVCEERDEARAWARWYRETHIRSARMEGPDGYCMCSRCQTFAALEWAREGT